MTRTLLIADSARDIARVIAFGARMTWPDCRVTIAGDGREALAHFAADGADLVVLDTDTPGADGFEVCRRIREGSTAPIMMLGARTGTLDKVRAFDLGADDYLTKPFDHLELLARLRALMRRAGGAATVPAPRPAADDFSLDFATHEVRVDGEPIRLTATEYRLLEVLVRHAGTILPHQLLLERVWGPTYVNDTHYLKVFVRRLRQKLGDSSERPRYIQTEWGTGYRFVPAR